MLAAFLDSSSSLMTASSFRTEDEVPVMDVETVPWPEEVPAVVRGGVLNMMLAACK
jgi:hypothetical protein